MQPSDCLNTIFRLAESDGALEGHPWQPTRVHTEVLRNVSASARLVVIVHELLERLVTPRLSAAATTTATAAARTTASAATAASAKSLLA